MKDEAHTYLITYDIADDKRRSRIADVLLSYGIRVQGSVFLIEARGAKYLRMKDKVMEHFNRNQDSLIVCDLGNDSSWSARYEKYGCYVNPTVLNENIF